ncbi:4-coumarate--CoA ligase 1 [Pseudocercospora fuligena]|uniref:4-coumarate--CoA ligase 1 n=1 Tax=Pseudocercospora fuligena TaxID=685502 RepID=A0A8H6VL13_9PEZI|nr:4-coumarate--CoA ligase 1 [Pseudocercospora fuligena]
MPETSKERLADIESEPVQNKASIFAYIQNGLKTNPDGAAVISTFQAHDHLADLTQESRSSVNGSVANGNPNCLIWTYKQLHVASLKVCAGLVALGVEPGMRIVTLVPNRVEWQLVLWTMSLLRVTLSSLDPGATTKPRRAELENFMSQIQPDVIIVADSEGANAIEEALKSCGSRLPKAKIQLDGVPNSPWMSLSELAKTGANHPIDIEKLESSALQPDPDRTAVIMFTSGTSSGNPKGCPRHVGSTCHILETQDWGPRRFTSSSRALAATANFRIIAPTIHLALWKMGGAAVLPDPSQGMKGWISAIETHRITFMLFIPALLHALVAHPDFSTSDMSSVEDIMQGGDMITRDLLVKTQNSFPHAKVAVGHGMTEGGGVFSWVWWDKKPDQLPYYAESIAPLGKIAPGARLRIRDPETGKVLKRNEPGELCMRCESLIKHYLNNINEETSFYTDEEGLRWFRTGDLATISEDGVIYILGRIKDIIKRSGIPITPAALESCIEQFTGSYTSVLAWPHEVLGQVPVAVVKDLEGSGKNEDEVKKEVMDKFGKDYALEHVVGLKQLGLEAFPLNATGKIMKSELVPSLKEYLEGKGKQ